MYLRVEYYIQFRIQYVRGIDNIYLQNIPILVIKYKTISNILLYV